MFKCCMDAFVPAFKSLFAMALRGKFDRAVTPEVLQEILRAWMELRDSRDLKGLMEELSSDICTHTHTLYSERYIQ
jgi:hypothetical protein